MVLGVNNFSDSTAVCYNANPLVWVTALVAVWVVVQSWGAVPTGAVRGTFRCQKSAPTAVRRSLFQRWQE